MQITKLYFKDKKFIESVEKEIEGAAAIIQINDKEKETILSFTRGTSLVEKMMARRQAGNIYRSGFLLKSGELIGKGFKIKEKEEEYPGEGTYRPPGPIKL